MRDKRMYHHETGEPVACESDLNYRTIDKCDSCEQHKPGVMLHAAGATGRVCPVLFLCDDCQNAEA